MIRHARTTPDGVLVYRGRIGRDAAFAGDAEQIRELADDPWHAGWLALDRDDLEAFTE